MTQCDAILAHLRAGNTLTPLEALQMFGTLALHSRANELRARGHDVKCTMVTRNGKRVGCYAISNSGAKE